MFYTFYSFNKIFKNRGIIFFSLNVWYNSSLQLLDLLFAKRVIECYLLVTFLMVIGIFKTSISLWVSIVMIFFFRKMFIFSIFPNLAQCFLNNFILFTFYCALSIVLSHLYFWYYLFVPLLFYWLVLTKYLPIALIF